MSYASLFPVKTRSLGLQTRRFEKEEGMAPRVWALVLSANLQRGDELVMPDGTASVKARTGDTVALYYHGEEVLLTAETIDGSAFYESLIKHLGEYAKAGEPYADPMALILERDPATYRLRTGRGWVINDRLMLSSGNITYPLLEGDDSGEAPGRIEVSPAEREPETDAQSAFDF